MIITRKHLSRRTMLRGIGAGIALPLLDGMVPAFTALAKTAAQPTKRFCAIYVPNGMNLDRWTPTTEGAAYEMTPIMQPLVPYRQHVLPVTGTSTMGIADPTPDENAGGNHTRAQAAFLTSARPRKTEGSELIQGGITSDSRKLLAPVEHEPTTKTGIKHVAGTISMANAGAGTARSDFFILVGDVPGFDAGGYGSDGTPLSSMEIYCHTVPTPSEPPPMTPTATSTATPTLTVTPSATPTITPGVTPTPSDCPGGCSPSPTPTVTARPSPTPRVAPTPRPRLTPPPRP